MNNIFDIINVPLGLLMKVLYGFCGNYALAVFLFALVIKIVLLPLGIQQQNSQIRMAKIRPKEQAIRGKYAGRTDTVTQQKMQSEILDMYKAENYSPMGGCLPLLIQLPIIFALYNIIRNPLTYISQFEAVVIENIKRYLFDNKEIYSKVIKSLSSVKDFKSIQEIDIIDVFNNGEWLASIKNAVEGIPADFKNIDFGFFGQMLTSAPAQAGLSILLLIPVLNFAASFLQTRLTKMLNANTMGNDMANNKSMKIMEYTMPLLVVYMSYQMNAALGLYWIFQSVLGVAQIIILSRLYPIPKISEEEYALARQQYGSVKKKKKKTVSEIGETDSAQDTDGAVSDEQENSGDGEGEKDEKYIAKTIPKGINPDIKKNYQKTGKKYKIKKRK